MAPTHSTPPTNNKNGAGGTYSGWCPHDCQSRQQDNAPPPDRPRAAAPGRLCTEEVAGYQQQGKQRREEGGGCRGGGGGLLGLSNNIALLPCCRVVIVVHAGGGARWRWRERVDALVRRSCCRGGGGAGVLLLRFQRGGGFRAACSSRSRFVSRQRMAGGARARGQPSLPAAGNVAGGAAVCGTQEQEEGPRRRQPAGAVSAALTVEQTSLSVLVDCRGRQNATQRLRTHKPCAVVGAVGCA